MKAERGKKNQYEEIFCLMNVKKYTYILGNLQNNNGRKKRNK